MYEVLLYIQFDKWVQQIIDEQIHIQCTIDEPPDNHIIGRELQASIQVIILCLIVEFEKKI